MANKSVQLTSYCIWQFGSAIMANPKFFLDHCIKAMREACQIDGCWSDSDFISEEADNYFESNRSIKPFNVIKKNLVIDHSYPWNLVCKEVIPMIAGNCSYSELVAAVEKYLKRIIVTKEEHKKLTANDTSKDCIEPNSTPETRLKNVLGEDGYHLNDSKKFPKETKRNTLDSFQKEYGVIKQNVYVYK